MPTAANTSASIANAPEQPRAEPLARKIFAHHVFERSYFGDGLLRIELPNHSPRRPSQAQRIAVRAKQKYHARITQVDVRIINSRLRFVIDRRFVHVGYHSDDFAKRILLVHLRVDPLA